MEGNQMVKAFVNAGLAKQPKPKRRRPGKQFKCHKCGAVMLKPEDTNVMVCSNCDKSFFIFDNMN